MGTDFAAVARLLANPARSAVLDELMGGRPRVAGELARIAGVRASTISEHLAALTDAGLVTVTAAGRHRHYRLAGPAVSQALEALALICPSTPVRTLRQSAADRAEALARTCYDHLAGALGVAVLDAAMEHGWLVAAVPDLRVTEAGTDALTRLGIDIGGARSAHRHFARPCLDRTERRMHLAGSLGAAVAGAFRDRGWVAAGRTARGLTVTATGRAGLRAALGVDVDVLAPRGS